MIEQITIVIPAYNEFERIPATLAEIRSFIECVPGLIKEVIVVDDGSPDSGKTIEASMYFINKMPLRILQLIENQGKWGAIQYGLEHATTDAILLLDADGSASIHELAKISKLQSTVLRKKVALFGSRFMKGAHTYDKSVLRTIVSRGYRTYVLFWYWFATGRKNIDDMQAPFKLLYKSCIKGTLQEKRFAGDVELACILDCTIQNIPLQFVHKDGGSIKVTTMFRMAWSTMVICLRNKFK